MHGERVHIWSEARRVAGLPSEIAFRDFLDDAAGAQRFRRAMVARLDPTRFTVGTTGFPGPDQDRLLAGLARQDGDAPYRRHVAGDATT